MRASLLSSLEKVKRHKELWVAAVLWIVTGSIMGSLIAVLSDTIKQNPWFLLYQSFVLGWLLVLTAITVEHIRGKIVCNQKGKINHD